MNEFKPTLAVSLTTTRTLNGHNRKGWLILDGDGNVLDFVVSEYDTNVPQVPRTPEISISPATWKYWTTAVAHRQRCRDAGTWIGLGPILRAGGGGLVPRG